MATINNFTLSQAVELFKQGKNDEAQALFLNILKSDEKNPDALYFMSMIDLYSGRHEVAKHRANELLIQKPTDGKALALIGNIMMSQGKLTEAAEHFDKGIRYNEADATLRVNAAICSIGLGDPDASIQHCKQAIDIDPKYLNSYNILGNAYMAKSDYEEAAKNFEQALKIQPKFNDARFNLGRALLDSGKYTKAEECFDIVLQTAPDNTHALTAKADVLSIKKNHVEAVSLYEQVIKINPNFAPAYLGLGKVYHTLNKPVEALSCFKRAIELNPNNIDALLFAGDAFRKLNRPEAAVVAFNDVLEIDPDNFQAKFHLSAIQDTAPPAKPEDDYVKQLFDEFADTYDESLEKIEYNAPMQLFKLAEQYQDNSTFGNLDILDLGCGTGLSGIQFKDISKKMIGIDLSPSMIDAARKRNIYDELIISEILDALVKHQNDTDITVCADIFPYIGDLEASFLAVSSALRNNGLFLFSVETHDGDNDYQLNAVARYSHSRQYIEKLADRRGFELLACNAAEYRQEAGKPVNSLVVALRKPA